MYNDLKVSANPAKSFFVYMLIKDITLKDAIGDLVDNAVDAIKAKAIDRDNLSDYKIEIKIDKNIFSISDNGNGMEAAIARNTAFNFGKSDDHNLIANSIGQFGIGMKRAFFKIGSLIKVQSTAPMSSFEIDIDVPEWLKDKSPDWQFAFNRDSLKENVVNGKDKLGLGVTIEKLSEEAIISFDAPKFVDELILEIEREHFINISNGLKIIINDYELKKSVVSLINDDNIKPILWEKIEDYRKVKIIAGISEPNGNDAGWYIFCNNRLILQHDQTEKTVWGNGVAKIHHQFYRFRGYVFFEASDSSFLPWNTTKTAVNFDSPYYKEVREEMVTMTRTVFELLNKLKDENEKDNPKENRKLNKAVEQSLKSVKSITETIKDTSNLKHEFVYPEHLFTPIKKDNYTTISFNVTTEKFEKISEHLGIKDKKEIGVTLFNYFYDNEL